MTGFGKRLSGEALAAMHPCYTSAARCTEGRMHLAVAPRCNLGCRYCEQVVGLLPEKAGGPGAAIQVLRPEQAVELVDEIAKKGWLRVVGIAGPGEPLANPETLETLHLLQEAHPELILCLSTNGLALARELPRLLEAGVRSVTVTINATQPEIAGELYGWMMEREVRYFGKEAMETILERQWAGLMVALRAGLLVKVNSVLIPGITEKEVETVARRAGELGVHRHNIMPLIPRGKMRDRRAPTGEELKEAQSRCERWVPQFRGCTQCRADVIAPPIKETNISCGAR